jgi:hypothetical protein
VTRSSRGIAVSLAEARKALPRRLRQNVSEDEIADALDRLVAAGLPNREGEDFELRARGSEAWIRISPRPPC